VSKASNLNGGEPTGGYIKANERVVLEASGKINATIGTLMHKGPTPYTITLQAGQNTITSNIDGLMYFSPTQDTTSIKLIEGGTKSTLFVAGQHTATDWQAMLDEPTSSGVCELVSKRTYIYTTYQNAKKYLDGKDPNILLQKIDEVCSIQDRCGFVSRCQRSKKQT